MVRWSPASNPTIEEVEVSAYRFPTDGPESDGTIEWNETTLVLVEVQGGGRRGLGYTYTHHAAASLIRDVFVPLLVGQPVFDIGRLKVVLDDSTRNIGRPGLSAEAVSAVDVALWDLKARIVGLPLQQLLGEVRQHVSIYGSGGFTSYSERRLAEQLGSWAEAGLPAVKMKVGRDPAADPARVSAARLAIGPRVDLFVDGNGAYEQRQTLALAEEFAALGVSWLEEPVPAGDVEGLRFIRERLQAGMRIAAGEYCSESLDFLRLLRPGAVDVLQADATRCGGVTGFLQAAALCEAFNLPLSPHTAPSIHLPLCCAVRCKLEPLEYFYDHVRIEQLFFDGAQLPRHGQLQPDETALGLGLRPRHAEMEAYRIQ